MKVRISDIAERVNVSTATVSLVLNNKPGVSDDMRNRIMCVAKEMNYRGRIGGTKHSVSFLKLTNDDQNYIYHHAYGAYIDEMIEGLSTEARSAGYNINMAYFRHFPDDIDLHFPESEGFIFLGSDFRGKDVSILNRISKPVVLLDSSVPHVRCDQIGVDNTDAVFRMLRHLKSKGHRRIGYASSGYETNDYAERELAFRRCMKELELEIDENNIFSVDPFESDNRSGLERADRASMPEAIVCCDDSIALKLYQALVILGYRITEDIVLCGFGHLPEGRFIHPPLTTFQFPQKYMGQLAFSVLQQRISEETTKAPAIRYKIQGKLIDRLSAAQL